ncbi:hypothetical protein [Brevundimonas nasdae]|uniref:hypothetical protein n=1 Tax=Brevundimonas nasdae TaxID=172043 RepID=UPI0028987F66|nr:hypothetical protein [Brevundimonas nasdae]
MTDIRAGLTFPRIGVGPVYEKAQIWLPLLIAEAMNAGTNVIEGKTFIDCRMEGPAVILPVNGCEFDSCDMGNSGGDPRNLFLSPMGAQKVVGAIAFKNCVFRRCSFFYVGMTGVPSFLAEFAEELAQAGIGRSA